MLKDYASSAPGHLSLGTPLRWAFFVLSAAMAATVVLRFHFWQLPPPLTIGIFLDWLDNIY
jgi:hypothetical protein